jgi:hypothetical protein
MSQCDSTGSSAVSAEHQPPGAGAFLQYVFVYLRGGFLELRQLTGATSMINSRGTGIIHGENFDPYF